MTNEIRYSFKTHRLVTLFYITTCKNAYQLVSYVIKSSLDKYRELVLDILTSNQLRHVFFLNSSNLKNEVDERVPNSLE